MAEVDRAILEQVAEECPGINPSQLENLLYHINKEYSAAKLIDDRVDFEKIRDDAIARCGLWDLLNQKPYQSAVGKYYGYRRAHLALVKREVGQVFEADKKNVLIAASETVTIRFRAFSLYGKLRFRDIDSGPERYTTTGLSTYVTEEQYIQAKRKALAIMNSHRGYR